MAQMKAVMLIEKDVNNDLISWCFPAVEPDTEKVLKTRCGLMDTDPGSQFRFSRFANQWQYIMVQQVPASAGSKVLAGALVILATDFHPSKYKQLLSIFCGLYEKELSPMPIMKGFLSVVTKGSMTSKAGDFDSSKHDPRKALVSPIKQFFEMFGMEAVVVWVAMVIKKRVFVYCDKLGDLLAAVRSFPLLGTWHRQNWNLLRPYSTTSEQELKELRNLGVYVAGFTDPSCANHTDLYDLYVDLTARTYTIADHAQGDFLLTKFHKQTAEAFLALAEKENDATLIKGIATKTKELIGNIEGLQTDHDDGRYITMEELGKKKMPPNMAKFLFNVALAEGMCKK